MSRVEMQQQGVEQQRQISSLKDLMNVGAFDIMDIIADSGQPFILAAPRPTQQKQHDYVSMVELPKNPNSVLEKKKKIRLNIKKELENLKSEVNGCYNLLRGLKDNQVVKTKKFSLPYSVQSKDLIKSMTIRQQEMNLTSKMFSEGLQSLKESMEQQESGIVQQQTYLKSFLVSPSSKICFYKMFPYKHIENQNYIDFYNIPIFTDSQLAPINISPYLLFIPLQIKNGQTTARLTDVMRTTPDIFEKQLVIKVIKNNTLTSNPDKLGPTVHKVSFILKEKEDQMHGEHHLFEEDDEQASQLAKLLQLRYRVYERILFSKLINICNKFMPSDCFNYDTSVFPSLSIFIDESFTLKFELKKLSIEDKLAKKNKPTERTPRNPTSSPYTINLYTKLFQYLTKLPSNRSLVKYIIDIKLDITRQYFLLQPRCTINVVNNTNDEVVYVGIRFLRTSSKQNTEQQYETQMKITTFATEFQRLNNIPLANTLSEIPRFTKEILNLANSGIFNQHGYLFKPF